MVTRRRILLDLERVGQRCKVPGPSADQYDLAGKIN